MGKKRFTFSEPKRKKPAKRGAITKEQKHLKAIKKLDEIPQRALKIFKTENEQRIYKALNKACYICANLLPWRMRKFVPKTCNKSYAQDIWSDTITKNFAWNKRRDYVKKTPEERIQVISASFDALMQKISITDIKASQIFDDYDTFTEKFNKIFEDYTIFPSKEKSTPLTENEIAMCKGILLLNTTNQYWKYDGWHNEIYSTGDKLRKFGEEQVEHWAKYLKSEEFLNHSSYDRHFILYQYITTQASFLFKIDNFDCCEFHQDKIEKTISWLRLYIKSDKAHLLNKDIY